MSCPRQPHADATSQLSTQIRLLRCACVRACVCLLISWLTALSCLFCSLSPASQVRPVPPTAVSVPRAQGTVMWQRQGLRGSEITTGIGRGGKGNRGEIIPPEGLRGRNRGASSLLTRLSVFTTQSLASLRFRKLGCTQPGGRVLAHRGGEPESSSPGTQQTDISADFSQEKAMQGSDH